MTVLARAPRGRDVARPVRNWAAQVAASGDPADRFRSGQARSRRAVRGGTVAVILAAVVLIALGAVLPPPAAAAERAQAERVIIVSYPRLSWATVASVRPPVLSEFVARAAVASLSIRTASAATGIGDGYVTIGAGNRAAVDAGIAGWAVGGSEPVDELGCPGGTGPPADAAASDPSAAATHLGATDVKRAADDALFGAEPGALGGALAEAGRTVAVIGNADADCRHEDGTEPHREVALAGMTPAGAVAAGQVDGLAIAEPGAPGGRVMDLDAYRAALADTRPDVDVLIVEMSDLERVEHAGLPAGTAARATADAAALGRSDEILAAVLAGTTPDDLVLVVAPAAAGDDAALTVFAIAGGGLPAGGAARSATTRRDGYVTLPDVGVTVLDALGVDVPDEMNGTAITAAGGARNGSDRLDQLVRDDERARFRDRAVGPVSVVFTAAQVVLYTVAGWHLRQHRDQPLPAALAAAGLVVMAMPLVAFVSGLAGYRSLGVAGYTVAVTVAAAAVAALALASGRWHRLAPPLVITGATLLLLVVDVATGGRLQLDTVFGYSATVAGRFAGFGNLAFALVGAGAVVVATGLVAVLSPRGTGGAEVVRDHRLTLASGVFVAAVVADGLPLLGADVGGALALVPAALLTLLLLAHVRLSAARVALVGAATLAVVAGFAALDLARPADERTHLGRFAARLIDGDAAVVLRRKAAANVTILTSSPWTLLLPAVVAGLVVLAWRADSPIGRLRRRVVGVHPGLVGAAVVGGLGFVVNDSGVAIPAMMLGVVVPWLLWLLAVEAGAPRPEVAQPTPATAEVPP